MINSRKISAKRRVEQFWNSFKSKSNDIEKSIGKKDSVEIVCQIIDKYLPQLSFQYGYNNEKNKFDFQFSSEGNIDYQFLAKYCISLAPKSLENWMFSEFKQPSIKNPEEYYNIYNKKFIIKDFKVYPTKENNKINISIYHEHFTDMSEKEQYGIIYIVLDDVLGEGGTDLWFNNIIALKKEADKQYLEIIELAKYLDDFFDEMNIEKICDPTSIWNTYKYKTFDRNDYDRKDIIAGVSRNMKLLNNEKSSIANVGADYIYLVFKNEFIIEDGKIEKRSKIEDYINDVLEKNHSGFLMGGATGINNSYIDVLVFDGIRSVKMIRKSVKSSFPNCNFEIRYFKK